MPASGHGEQQLVLIAAVQGMTGLHFSASFSNGSQGNRFRENLGAYARLLTNVRQVSLEAVAEIDHGTRKPFRLQESADRDSR